MHEVQRPGQRIVRHELPHRLEDALELLDQHGARARVIAGGTDLLLELARGVRAGVDVLVDLSRVPGLDRIEAGARSIRLGPLVTHNQAIATPAVVAGALPLAQACLEVGSPALRNRATIAGNLVTASPANDTISALVALAARLRLRSLRGERSVSVGDFCTGVRQTVLAPGEIVTSIDVPSLGPGERGVFVKLGQRRAQAISIVHLAVVVEFDGAVVTGARLALGSVAPTIVRAGAAEAFLVGRRLDDATVTAAAALAAGSVEPIDDVRASAVYRTDEVAVMVTRALVALRDGREREHWPARSVSLAPGASRCSGRDDPARPAAHDAGTIVRAAVNGRVVEAGRAVGRTLLDWLRDEAGCTGPKEGCAEGECGACTVHLDGAAVLGCLVPAVLADGATITTIEGLATGAHLTPLQQAFLDQFAVQCGYCIPGFVMAADRLLAECPAPDRDQIAQGLSGNLCRCTGYYRFFDALEQVARPAEARA